MWVWCIFTSKMHLQLLRDGKKGKTNNGLTASPCQAFPSILLHPQVFHIWLPTHLTRSKMNIYIIKKQNDKNITAFKQGVKNNRYCALASI